MKERKKDRHSQHSKQGSVGIELIIIIGVLFVFSVISVFGFTVMSDFNTDIQAELDWNNESKEMMAEQTGNYPALMDNATVFILIAFWVFALAGAALIDSHPMFFWISVFIIVLMSVASIYISNYYEELADDDDLRSYSVSFPKTNWIMTHLLHLCIAIGLTIGLSLYGKKAG